MACVAGDLALCYQQHRGPPLQKTQGWGTHVSLWERNNRAWWRLGHPPSPDSDACSGVHRAAPEGASKLSPALQRGVARHGDPSPVGTTETRTPHPGRPAPPNGDEKFCPAIAVKATSRKAREVAHPRAMIGGKPALYSTSDVTRPTRLSNQPNT